MYDDKYILQKHLIIALIITDIKSGKKGDEGFNLPI